MNSSPSLLLCSTVAAGHIAPLLNIAAEGVRRGYSVTVAVSGDPNEPAGKWRDTVTKIGAQMLDLDETFLYHTDARQVGKRIVGRAAEGSHKFAEAVLSQVNPLPSVILFDFFALWGWLVGHYVNEYLKSHSLPPASVSCVLSGFPGMVIKENMLSFSEYDEWVAKFPIPYTHNRHISVIPAGVPVFGFSTPRIARHTPMEFHLIGPLHIDLSIPDGSSSLLSALCVARREGVRVVYIALGTMVLRFFGGTHAEYFRHLYHSVTLAALRAGMHFVFSFLLFLNDNLLIVFLSYSL